MPQKGTEKRRSSENVISTDKSALLWMYCRGIAPFETPTFSKTVGELIACATSDVALHAEQLLGLPAQQATSGKDVAA